MSDPYTLCDPKPHVSDVEKIAAATFGKHGTSNDAQLIAGLLSGIQCQLIGLTDAVQDLTDLLATAHDLERAK